MIIGVPKEIKDQEYRVSLTPVGAAALHQGGHAILLETGAGAGSGLDDAAYQAAGAEIVSSKSALFDQADLILKVKEPLPVEFDLFRREQILFTFLHLAANPSLLRFLLEREVTAIAYETIALADGALPLLKPMSEVAGRMAVLMGAYYLQRGKGGMGLLLSGVAGVKKGRVTIIGGGIVGKNAAQIALNLGAEVTIYDIRSERRSELDDFFKGRVVTLYPYPEAIAEELKRSDLAVGAVSRPGEKAPHLVTREMVGAMQKGSVVVDVSIDQGGCFETARPTSHSDPVYEVGGVLHYCVSNIPGVVPKTSTFALANETFPYINMLAARGFKQATEEDAALAQGVNVHQGRIVHPAVAAAFRSEVRSN